MQDNLNGNEEYTVIAKGVEVKCHGIAQVATVVNILSDQQVPLPLATFARLEDERLEAERAARHAAPPPLAQAVEEILATAPAPLRPIEVVRAVRKRGLRNARYNNVYATLRYGPFEKRDGRWMRTA